jgi:hypothetical protein
VKSADALQRIRENVNSISTHEIANQSARMSRIFDASIQRIEGRLDSFGEGDSTLLLDRAKAAYNRYLEYQQADKKPTLSLREYRYLAGGLSRSDIAGDAPLIISDDGPQILELLIDNAKTVYIAPVIRAAFSHWCLLTTHSGAWKVYRELILCLLKDYNGRNPQYKILRESIDLIAKSEGPDRLGVMLSRDGRNPIKAITSFGFSPSLLSSEYFENAMVSYCNRVEHIELEYVWELLGHAENSKSRDYMLVLCSFLLLKSNWQDSASRDQMRDFAVTLIGDPQYGHMWKLPTDRFRFFQVTIEDARHLLSSWINEDIVNVFFSKLSAAGQFDFSRLEFWKGYVKKIPVIKIAATDYKIHRMTGSELNEDLVNSRTIRVTSRSCPPAILFRTNRNLLVEFGELNNALYSYNSNHVNYKLFESTRIESTIDMKMTTLPIITDTITSQGRKLHHEGWQRNFAQWLRTALGIRRD